VDAFLKRFLAGIGDVGGAGGGICCLSSSMSINIFSSVPLENTFSRLTFRSRAFPSVLLLSLRCRCGDRDGEVVGDRVGDLVGDVVGDLVGDRVGEVVGEVLFERNSSLL